MTAQFAEIISRLATIQEQVAKEKERTVRKSEEFLARTKGEVLREKMSQSLKDQRLTFSELEEKLRKNPEISFSRGLFSQNLQKLINEEVIRKTDGKYFLTKPVGQSVTDW